MKLETAERISSYNVTEEELINAFNDDEGRGEFIILSEREQVYIQASGEGDDPYIIEYREGDADHHFQCVEEISKEQVKSMFLKYLNGDDSWKSDCRWDKLENKPWWKFW